MKRGLRGRLQRLRARAVAQRDR